MYAVTSVPLDSRTRAILRSAEFGFFGVIVLTCKQTPRFCGHPCIAGCFGFDFCGRRGLRINWLIVGMNRSWRPAIGVERSYRHMAPVQGEVIILIGAWTPGQWGDQVFAAIPPIPPPHVFRPRPCPPYRPTGRRACLRGRTGTGAADQ